MEQGAIYEKIEKIKMPYRLLIWVGTLVVLAGVFTWLVVLPKTDTINRLEKDITRLEQRLTQAKIKARNLKKFREELAQVDAQFKEALRLLPDRKEIPSLLTAITRLGTESNLTFLRFSPRRERPRDFYVEIPVDIEVRGKYHDVAVFFDRVGRMERIVNILDVSMRPVKKNSNILNTKCVAVTYRFKGTRDDSASKPKKKKKK